MAFGDSAPICFDCIICGSSNTTPFIFSKAVFPLSIFTYLISAVIPFGFFTFLLYVWLWNTFGKTVLEISPNKMCVRQKNKLFSKTKTYLKSEIQEVTILDLSIIEDFCFLVSVYWKYNCNIIGLENVLLVLNKSLFIKHQAVKLQLM